MDSFFPYYNGPSWRDNRTDVGNSVYGHYLGDLRTILATPDYQKWIYSLIGCVLVGLSGVFPVLLFSNSTVPDRPAFKIGPQNLKCLLSFAVGSLLGDVFLHLLPEAWNGAIGDGCRKEEALQHLGMWILFGITSFLACEIMASYQCQSEGHPDTTTAIVQSSNGAWQMKCPSSQTQVVGYLNLVANGFDNFTHGLAVAGSFIISPKIGILTTVAILFHEIPHEIGDFAILLRSGFNPWSAAKAQLSTATIGLAGAVFTLSVDCMKTVGNYTGWILPFTAGCFIHIALSNLLPDLVKEENHKESMKQFLCLVIGIGTMAAFTLISIS